MTANQPGDSYRPENPVADHLEVLKATITALPPACRRRLMVICDATDASHGLIERLDELAARPGHHLVYSVGWDLGERERVAICLVPGPGRSPSAPTARRASAAPMTPAAICGGANAAAGSKKLTSPK